jgi:hypothetical protein
VVTYQIELDFKEDGTIVPSSPIDVLPGKHTVLLVFGDSQRIAKPRKRRLSLTIHDYPIIEPDNSLRREELYDTDRG